MYKDVSGTDGIYEITANTLLAVMYGTFFCQATLWASLVLAPSLTSNRHHLSYDDCLENKGRLQDCLCSIGSYHCIQCYAHIL